MFHLPLSSTRDLNVMHRKTCTCLSNEERDTFSGIVRTLGSACSRFLRQCAAGSLNATLLAVDPRGYLEHCLRVPYLVACGPEWSKIRFLSAPNVSKINSLHLLYMEHFHVYSTVTHRKTSISLVGQDSIFQLCPLNRYGRAKHDAVKGALKHMVNTAPCFCKTYKHIRYLGWFFPENTLSAAHECKFHTREGSHGCILITHHGLAQPALGNASPPQSAVSQKHGADGPVAALFKEAPAYGSLSLDGAVVKNQISTAFPDEVAYGSQVHRRL